MTSSRIADVIAHSASSRIDLSCIGRECDGSKFHSPRPLLVHSYSLVEAVEKLEQGAGADLVNLCSTCRDNLSVYLSVLLSHDGATPQAVRRDFGNQIRALGDRAWDHHIKRSG